MTERESQFVPEESANAGELAYPARLKIRGTVPPEFRENIDWNSEKIRNIFRGEREKTPEDLESIDYCNQLGRRLGKKYGFDWAFVPSEYVHIFPEDKFVEFHERHGRDDVSGITGSTSKWPHIDIRDVHSRYSMVGTMFHEMCHGESIQRLQLFPERDKRFFLSRVFNGKGGAKWEGKTRRSGLTIRVGEVQHFFTDINEAITRPSYSRSV